MDHVDGKSWLRICDLLEEKFAKNTRLCGYDKENGVCVYNHEFNGGCAIGCILSKELAASLPENTIATLKFYHDNSDCEKGHWLGLIMKELGLSINPYNVERLAALQRIHDRIAEDFRGVDQQAQRNSPIL